MTLSQEDYELIDKVASGEIGPDNSSFYYLLLECNDVVEVYEHIMSNPSLTKEIRLAVDLEFIEYLSEWENNYPWEFKDGALRHSYVVHWIPNHKPSFDHEEDRLLLDNIFHYLADEYVPSKSDPSADDIRMKLINKYVYKENRIAECLKMGYLDWLDGRQRNDLVQWCREQCKEQPEKMEEYIKAGLWRFLSVHERASRVAERLDKATEGIHAYSELIEYLRMEESSPLKKETSDIIKELSSWFKTLPYENDIQ